MTATRLLVIDIGNSRTKLGVFEGRELVAHEFFPSAIDYIEKICQQAAHWKAEYQLSVSILGSVVPRLGDTLATFLEDQAGLVPLLVEGFKERIMPLRVDHPETVGVDRIINSYAALHLVGAPVIVISLGTAITCEVISAQGEYLGGTISPGVRISLEALSQRTALLPPAVWRKPKRIIGKNTIEHMEAGIYFGTISLLEGMIRRIRQEMGAEAPVIGTGGISQVMGEETVFDHHDLYLTLKGLQLIYEHHGPKP